MEAGSYVRRLPKILSTALKVRGQAKKFDMIYAFGLDMALLATVATLGMRIKRVYEVADIMPVVIGNSFIARTVRMVEKIVIRQQDRIVLTSDRFFTGFYQHYGVATQQSQFFVLENKIPAPDETRVRSRPAIKADYNRPIKIGYFGLLRCPRSIEVLNELVAQSDGRISLEIHGRVASPLTDADLAGLDDGVTYHGEFVWPDDLEDMYQSADIIWGCFPYGNTVPGSWQWSRTNRYYESLYYGAPIIALKGSGDADRVLRLGNGMVIDLHSIQEAVNILSSEINYSNIALWQAATLKVPDEEFIYHNEHRDLIDSFWSENTSSDSKSTTKDIAHE